MKNKFFLCSPVNGCESNSYLGSRIVEFFKRNGWEFVNKSKFAEYIIINSCGAVKSTESQTIKLIEFFLKRYGEGEKKIIVCGCLPRINKNLGKYEGVRIIKNLEEFNELVNSKLDVRGLEVNQFKKGLYHIEEYNLDDHFVIKIASGCMGNCSYCSVKFAIGGLRSKAIKVVLTEFKKGIEQGYDKFYLIGDDCGCYGQDIGTSLVELLKEMFKIKKDIKVSLNYIEPEWLVKLYSGLKKFFIENKIGYVRIPLQSGSDRILELMNRHYKIKDALEAIDEIRGTAIIDTYLIVGFPTEEKEDFMKSVEASKHFDKATFRVYSDRPNTVAAKMFPKVIMKEIKERMVIVMEMMKKAGNIDLNLSGEVMGDTKDGLVV